LGISKSTYYRRRRKAARQAALATRQMAFERAEEFLRQLQAELAGVAKWHAVMAAELSGPMPPRVW
jgi:hypothetical protein